MPAKDALTRILKNELNANDLSTLGSAFDSFVKGTDEERAAAEAIAGNAKDAIQSYMAGQLSRSDLEFVLTNARDGTIALVDARALRLRKAAVRTFFGVLTKWLLSRI